MADNTPKTHEELKKLAEEIRENVRRALAESRSDTAKNTKTPADPVRSQTDAHAPAPSLSIELDVHFSNEHTVAEEKNGDVRGGDDFWDLGKPKERIYAPPKFSGKSLSVTDVTDGRDRDGASEITSDSAARDNGENVVQAEKILPREAYDFGRSQSRSAASSGSTGRVRNTIDGPRSVPSDRVVTSSYRRRAPHHQQPVRESAKKPSETVKTYRPEGLLIREVCVKTWESETEFYGRFAADAHRSHESLPKTPYTAKLEAVPYFSYVPQYAHMNLAQVEFYRHLRENIRRGIYPDCDLAYIQLYIFEIINLPDVIDAETGAELLASIWLNYRARHPRLDSFMCEWMADYCLIGGCPLPDQVGRILPEIVPKAQFKEFYLNNSVSAAGDDFGKTVLEVSSDYDYRSSRYYKDNAEQYNRHIPAAADLVMKKAKNDGRGIFAMDRVYKMTRDSYSGAIVSSGIKRRIDIEFLSFTRRADTRQAVTAIAKYAENRLRAVLGIKAKLGVDKIPPEDAAVIDAYFAPLMPQNAKKPKEDRYMPADYMKNYESEDSGFDFAAAQAIEAQSWVNTSRLTGDDSYSEEIPAVPEYEADIPVSLAGEISTDPYAGDTLPVCSEPDDSAVSIERFDPLAENSDAAHDTMTTEIPAESDAEDEKSDDIRAALTAALAGEFRLYCRRNNLYEGEVADRVNNIFLDELGDVVLENSGSGFLLIEDYREDVENWLQ